MGSLTKVRWPGSIGDFGCFSFHTHKNISTLGEGGMLTVKSNDHARHVCGLRHNGMRPYSGERERYWIPAMTDVDFDIGTLWPYNFCIGEIQCALGAKMLDRLDDINAERARRAQAFMDAFSDYPELKFQTTPDDCGHAWHLLAVLFDGEAIGKTRDNFMDELIFSRGIKAVVQYCPLYRYPMFKKAGFGLADCGNTDYFFDNMVSLPFHHWMPKEEFQDMISLVKKALDALRLR